MKTLLLALSLLALQGIFQVTLAHADDFEAPTRGICAVRDSTCEGHADVLFNGVNMKSFDYDLDANSSCSAADSAQHDLAIANAVATAKKMSYAGACIYTK